MRLGTVEVQLAASILVACLGCSKGKIEVSQPLPPIPINLDGTPGGELGEIKGLWTTSCFRAGSGIFGLDSQLRELRIDGEDFTMIVGAFTDEKCSQNSIEKLIVSTGKIKIGAQASVAGAFAADFTINQAELIAFTSDAAAELNNSVGTCGKSDWVAGASLNVQNLKDCDYLYTLGIVPFDILTKDKDKLFLGAYYESNDVGKKADARPSKIASGEVYISSQDSIFEDKSSADSGEKKDTGSSDSPIDTGGSNTNALPLTYKEVSGDWSAPSGSLTRGSSAPIIAQGIRFQFRTDATKFSLNYSICRDISNCSGGDVYARFSGDIESGGLYATCTLNGVNTRKQVGKIDGLNLKILAIDSFKPICPTGNEFVIFSRNIDGTYTVNAVADNYGRIITGVAAVTKRI